MYRPPLTRAELHALTAYATSPPSPPPHPPDGRILGGADVAYVFGDFGAAHKGQMVWPGEIVASTPRAREAWRTSHPTPRRTEHVRGLIVGYTRADDRVLDPFAGGCSTLAAAVQLGRSATGIEVEPAYVAEAATRLRDLACDPAPSIAGPLFASRAR